MNEDLPEVLRSRLDEENARKLTAIANRTVRNFVAEAAMLCEPERVFICSDDPRDVAHVRKQALALGEERPLAIEGHTYHFDGPKDQGRDRQATKYLVPNGEFLSKALKQIDRDEGLSEVRGLLKGAMRGRTMIVRFLSLGPPNSPFSIPCLQCTDSLYVAHSEDLLYRRAYEQFRALDPGEEVFCFLHSAGRLDERMISVDWEKRRIYIDYLENRVYGVNTQYAGNSMGLKKLALRLTIRRAEREGWLAEHMLLMGVHGPGGRRTYFSGAFPSACGKTSTAMLPGETILGDDIAYIRNIGGEARAVNAEAGIFGIIQNINPEDDPLIYDVLSRPGEIIFSNVLVNNGKPYWLGMGQELPPEGENPSGFWYNGMTDEHGEPVPATHKNARYTVALKALANCDPELDNPLGVPLAGIMYGGRDYGGYVPVQQSYDWEHGIVCYGAALETVATFATVDGEEEQPEINMMAIQDFVSIPLGAHIRNNLEFAKTLRKPPLVFGVNYFLRDEHDHYVNKPQDKHVWVKWMELRAHGEAGAIPAPTGLIPRYEDLRRLFREVRGLDYPPEAYVAQFTTRIPENLAKVERVERFYREGAAGIPERVFEILAAQRERLEEARRRFGDRLSPFDLDQKAP